MKQLLFVASLLACNYVNAQYFGMDSVQFNGSLKGLALTPSDYAANPAKKYPLIIGLAGNGEMGTSLSVLFNQGIPKRIKAGKSTYQVMTVGDTARFLYVCPLSPVSTAMGQPNNVNAVIDYMVANYRVDTNKIMITGYSQGANDAMRYALYPATGDPVWGFGGGFDNRQQRVRYYVIASPPYLDFPFANNFSRFKTYNWGARFFHGSLDGGVTTPAFSQMQNDSVNANHSGASQRFLLAGYGHSAQVWDSVYSTNGVDSNINIYRWLVQSPGNVVAAPFADAGPPQTISVTSTSLNAAGSYSPNGTITTYNWQQVTGPNLVTLVNPNTPTPVVTNMTPGGAYEFKLTVTDVVGASGSDSTSVIVTNSALPVELVYFRADKKGSGNVLQWATASEQNNDYFAIERSTDGVTFYTIGSVPGVGNSSTMHQYSFVDTKSPAGTVYYRLRQVDKDAKFKFSVVATISGNGKAAGEKMYPNTVVDNLTISLANTVAGNGFVSVFDIAGRKIKEKSFSKTADSFTTTLNMNELHSGVYIVQVNIGTQYQSSERIMKQ
jgi:hypothetical protein